MKEPKPMKSRIISSGKSSKVCMILSVDGQMMKEMTEECL